MCVQKQGVCVCTHQGRRNSSRLGISTEYEKSDIIAVNTGLGPLPAPGVCVPSRGTESQLRDLHWLTAGKQREIRHFLLGALGVGVRLTSASPRHHHDGGEVPESSERAGFPTWERQEQRRRRSAIGVSARGTHTCSQPLGPRDRLGAGVARWVVTDAGLNSRCCETQLVEKNM